jgi:hypothetical protein
MCAIAVRGGALSCWQKANAKLLESGARTAPKLIQIVCPAARLAAGRIESGNNGAFIANRLACAA